MKIRIGTRGSKLALWQAHFTKDRLEQAGYEVELKIITTKGDAIQHLSFDKIEGKGFFTKEIEDVLLDGSVDLAVHSCKDMPTENPPGLKIAAFSHRADPADVLLIKSSSLDRSQPLNLAPDAVVGTSSARRKAQLLALQPGLTMKDIRGNVPTRMRKLNEGQFDAIVLAAAGLDRLEADIGDLVRFDLPVSMFIPAPAQGILAYQVRADDERMSEVLEHLHDQDAFFFVDMERRVLAAFHGGCQMPLGVHATGSQAATNLWVSRAHEWHKMPRRMQLTVGDGQLDAQKVIERFNKKLTGSVFISTDLAEQDVLRRHLEAEGIEVAHRSLIQFEPSTFDASLDDVDWLFFSSKNAARFFFEHLTELPPHIRIAAINSGTGRVLADLGYDVAFTGSGGDLQTIAVEFDAEPGSRILFPRAQHSNRTIQQGLKSKQVEDVVVYRNTPVKDAAKRTDDILIFTSPMNVEAYFGHHALDGHQRAIAIGSSTAKTLQDHGIQPEVAYEPTRWALVDVVFRVLTD